MDNFRYFPKRTNCDLPPQDTLEIYGFFYQLLFRFLGIIKVLQKFTMLAWNYDNAISVFPCQSQEILEEVKYPYPFQYNRLNS